MADKDHHPLTAQERAALILARGAVALVLLIAAGAFGRAFVMSILLRQDTPISESATQLLTAMGSALVGGAVGFIGGSRAHSPHPPAPPEPPSEKDENCP